MSIRKLLIVPAVLLSLAYGFGMASVANAEVILTTGNYMCSYEDGVLTCDAWHLQGIKRIGVYMDTGIGQVEVFDQTYEKCPTSVSFELDPIVMEYDTNVHVVECEPDPGVGQPDPGKFKSPDAPSRPVVRDLVSRN